MFFNKLHLFVHGSLNNAYEFITHEGAPLLEIIKALEIMKTQVENMIKDYEGEAKNNETSGKDAKPTLTEKQKVEEKAKENGK